MASKSLRCVALAYKTCGTDEIPTDEEQLEQWDLPEDQLILLAIIGIKVHILARFLSFDTLYLLKL